MQKGSERKPHVSQITGITDPIIEGLQNGWSVDDAADIATDEVLTADVLIIGTGAGGGTSAEIFTKAGLKVLMLEEGPLKSSSDFNMDERSAYHDLYQEGAGRMSKDGSMSILQGRCVGGTTVINWTSSFRTPPQTLSYWQDEFQLKNASVEDMTPWFEQMQTRLNIADWTSTPNENNGVLSRGCEALGYDWKVIPRNVSGCWNLGYCGVGCPTNAKQSMLVSTIPSALDKGARLVYSARVDRLLIEGKKVIGAEITALDKDYQPTGKTLLAKAPHMVMACGGINGPALLLRSNVPDPYKRVGKRTFLHPTAFSFAEFDQLVDPYYGAPQSIYSDEFQWKNVTGPGCYKLEVTPMQPALTAALLLGHGMDHFRDIEKLPHLNGMIALVRDGFDPESPGANIELASDGTAIIDYPVNEYLCDAIRRAMITMAEVQFAAGAKRIRPSHLDAHWYNSRVEAITAINELEFNSNTFTVGSAHVMGGLAMGEDQTKCAVDSQGKYHHLDNLYVFDGSVFPTSIGANPQLSVYGFSCKFATQLVEKITA